MRYREWNMIQDQISIGRFGNPATALNGSTALPCRLCRSMMRKQLHIGLQSSRRDQIVRDVFLGMASQSNQRAHGNILCTKRKVVVARLVQSANMASQLHTTVAHGGETDEIGDLKFDWVITARTLCCQAQSIALHNVITAE